MSGSLPVEQSEWISRLCLRFQWLPWNDVSIFNSTLQLAGFEFDVLKNF